MEKEAQVQIVKDQPGKLEVWELEEPEQMQLTIQEVVVAEVVIMEVEEEIRVV